jgi:hypothetical protein
MKLTVKEAAGLPRGVLAALSQVPLDDTYQRMLDEAAALMEGSPMWRRRKMAEARDLLVLAQISQRLRIEMLDLGASLRAVLALRAPVACRPGEDGQLRLSDGALLGLTYAEEALRQPLPGYAFFQVLLPNDPWHANIPFGPIRPLCLGDRLPAGIRVKELILMAYGALTMQTVQIDEFDSVGVLNVEAARWWQRNMSHIPLTREPFLAVDPDTGSRCGYAVGRL